MKETIVVKTDASVKDGQGCAVAYRAVIYNEDGKREVFKNSKYIRKQLKTTDAETLAAAYAIKQLHKYFPNLIDQYPTILKSDCEHTLNQIKQVVEESKYQRYIRHLTEDFNSFETRWISREQNTTADAMAREQLRKGFENE